MKGLQNLKKLYSLAQVLGDNNYHSQGFTPLPKNQLIQNQTILIIGY